MVIERLFKLSSYILLALLLNISACDSGNSNKNSKGVGLDKVWSYEYNVGEGGPRTVPEVVSLDDNSIVLFAGGNRIQAFNLKTGNREWVSGKNSRVRELVSVELIVDESQIFSTHLFKAVSWSLDNGDKMWEFGSGEGDHSREVYSLGRYDVNSEHLFVGISTGELVALDRETGNISYKKDVDKMPRAITYTQGNLYISQAWIPEGGQGQSRGGIVKVDASKGDKIWEFKTKSGGFYDMSPVVRRGRVYAGTQGGQETEFVCLDAETGDVIWRNSNVRVYWAIWSETEESSRIFINNGRNLLALNPAGGEVLWRTDMKAGHGEGGLAYLDGYVYHPHGLGLRVVDGETGEIVHVEWPENGFYWEVASGHGKIFAQDSGAFYAYEPFSPD